MSAQSTILIPFLHNIPLLEYQLPTSSFSLSHVVKLVHYHVISRPNTFNSLYSTNLSTYKKFLNGIILTSWLCHQVLFFIILLHIQSYHKPVQRKLNSILGQKTEARKLQERTVSWVTQASAYQNNPFIPPPIKYCVMVPNAQRE